MGWTLGEPQGGFRRRPRTDCVLIIYQLVEKHKEFNLETLITFLDYEKVCDKIITNLMFVGPCIILIVE